MFRFYLDSRPGDYSHVIALTVTNDTITAYTRSAIKNHLAYIVSSQYSYCLNNFEKQQAVKFIRRKAARHGLLHSNDENETSVAHHHISYSVEITPDILFNFLNYFRQCNLLFRNPSFIQFINHKSAPKILKSFEKFKKGDNKLGSDIFDYNVMYYFADFMPTVSEHNNCLVKSERPCLYNGRYTPLKYKETYTKIDTAAAIAIASIAILAYGLFSRKCRSIKPIEQKPMTFEDAIKHSFNRLT